MLSRELERDDTPRPLDVGQVPEQDARVVAELEATSAALHDEEPPTSGDELQELKEGVAHDGQ